MYTYILQCSHCVIKSLNQTNPIQMGFTKLAITFEPKVEIPPNKNLVKLETMDNQICVKLDTLVAYFSQKKITLNPAFLLIHAVLNAVSIDRKLRWSQVDPGYARPLSFHYYKVVGAAKRCLTHLLPHTSHPRFCLWQHESTDIVYFSHCLS